MRTLGAELLDPVEKTSSKARGMDRKAAGMVQQDGGKRDPLRQPRQVIHREPFRGNEMLQFQRRDQAHPHAEIAGAGGEVVVPA